MSQTQIASTQSGTVGGASQESEIEDEKKDSSRDYVILETVDGDLWKKVTTVRASSVESALRSLGAALESKKKYVAVPARNWKPVTPNVETKTTIALRFE